MARVLEIAKKLNRVYKNDKLAITADVMPSYKRLSCNDLGADFPLYGGLPYGRIVTISGKEHSGKAQPLDALVLTDTGYVEMRSIKVGDKVFGRDGNLHKVIGVYPQGIKRTYKVTFNDGTSTVCCNEHLWNINKLVSGAYSKNSDKSLRWKTVELSELIGKPLVGSANEYLYHIPRCDVLNFSNKDFTIDPYLLGCLIGDGALGDTGISFSNKDSDIIQEVNQILKRDYNMKLYQIKNSDCDYALASCLKENSEIRNWCFNYVITYDGVDYYGVKQAHERVSQDYDISLDKFSAIVRGNYSKKAAKDYTQLIERIIIKTNPTKVAPNKGSKLRNELDYYGLRCLSHQKHIPKEYLYNSIDVRLSILQGLMDTDGYIDNSGYASFSSTSKQLAEDVAFLVRSFGGFVRLRHCKSSYVNGKGVAVPCKDVYEVVIQGLSKSIPIVRCKRKYNRWIIDNTKQVRHHLRAIKDISYEKDQPCQCILIDSDEHLYLTNDLIVTHNTTGACTFLAAYQRTHPDKTCVFVDVEHALDKEFQSAMTGLDLTTLLYLNPEGMSGEQILDAILELQDSDDIGMIVLDSIASLVSSRDYDTDIEKDNGMAASIAKPLAKFIRKMLDTLAAKDNILLLINQVRQVGTTFTGAAIYDEPGGHSPKYYASVKLRFGTRTFTNGDKVDCRDGENADGFRLTFATTKNKTASTQRGGGFLTFRYDKGLDWAFDLLEVAIKYEFIERPNSMTYILMNLETGEPYLNEEGNPLKFVGKQKLRDFLSSNIEFQNEYLAMLNRYIQATAGNYGSLLDARTLAAINAEEDSTNGERDSTSDKQDEVSD